MRHATWAALTAQVIGTHDLTRRQRRVERLGNCCVAGQLTWIVYVRFTLCPPFWAAAIVKWMV